MFSRRRKATTPGAAHRINADYIMIKPEEVIVYGSPQEKLWADWLMAHPEVMMALQIVFGIFFLFVLFNVLRIWWSVHKDMNEVRRRWRRFDRD